MKSWLVLTLGLFVTVGGLFAEPVVHLIGDSTVCIWGASAYPKEGWGQQFGRLFVSGSVAIDDKAVSGTSSKSFYENSSEWAPVRNSLRAGDYLFIQFGHNDEKVGTTGYTSPYTTYEQYLGYYVDQARAKGAYPVLVTPVERNNWQNGVIVATHGNYPDAMRQLAAAKNVPLIDLTVRSTAKYESLGQSYTTYHVFMNLFSGQYPNYPNGNSDNTHFQENGAKFISSLVADGVRAESHSEMKSLATHLK